MLIRVLMVSPYPPIRDGIGNYAVQEVRALLDGGNEVEVLSPYPSAAHHHLDLRSTRGPLALAKRVHRYDRVIIQFHPDVFYPLPLAVHDRLRVTAGLVVAFGRKRNVEVRLHEMNFDWGREGGVFGRLFRLLWRLPIAVTVHTEHERAELAASTGLAASRIEVAQHGRHFIRRATDDRLSARDRLGIDRDAFMFVSIGFVQPHKGFDRAVRAFDGMAAHGCQMHIVGSVRVDEPGFEEYAASLRQLVESTPGAHLNDGYLSDELFDVWIIAADVVVLPYHHIWSSGVLERASLYGAHVIATRVGGLGGQERPTVELVADDDELAHAMRSAARVPEQNAAPEPWLDVSPGNPDRGSIMTAIRERAARCAPLRAP